jgi:hypothetical protein
MFSKAMIAAALSFSLSIFGRIGNCYLIRPW